MGRVITQRAIFDTCALIINCSSHQNLMRLENDGDSQGTINATQQKLEGAQVLNHLNCNLRRNIALSIPGGGGCSVQIIGIII
jgi:hypothetical protein